MKLTQNQSAFTLVELMIVIVIIGTLGKLSADAYFKMYDKSKYEKCIYTLQQYVQQARNLSLVNEAKCVASGANSCASYSSPTGHGVEITLNNNKEIQFTLFQDKDSNQQFTSTDNSEKLLSYSEKNILLINSLTGTLSQDNTPANSFNSFIVYFYPDPDPKAQITTDKNEILRNFELKLSHIRRDGTSGYAKKFFFDSITRISEINDYPILVDSFKKDDTTIIVSSNDTLQESIDISSFLTQFSILQDNTVITPISGSIQGKDITLKFGSSLPDSGNPIQIIYNSGNILSIDSIPLQSRSLQIQL